jgi:hypothetical protein
VASSSPPPRLRGARGEVPPLERGRRCLPAFTPVLSRFFRLSPYEVPELGVRPARDGRAGPQAGQLGAERGSHPPRYTPSYRAPRVMFSPVAGPPDLPQPPATSRWPQHRRAPHASWDYVFAPCRGGDLHPLSHAQPSGFAPRTLSGSPNIEPWVPPGWDCGRAEGCAPNAPRLVLHEPGYSPGMQLTRQKGGVAAPTPSRPAPAPTGRSVVVSLGRTPSPRKFWATALAPKGTSIRVDQLLPTACNHGHS